ncbi:MAG: radical SAM protein [Planctomycetota bacterium]
MASIYLINPRADFPTYYGAEVYAGRGYKPAAFLADLVVPTLAAMIPSDFDVKICDEHLEPVDFNANVDYVGITGKISQWGRMKAIAREFRRRGVIVIIGGPHASLSPEVTRPHCDILVRDEIEEIADELWSDLRSGRFREEYVGGRPDLRTSPTPRWDLYAKYNSRVLTATVQTARGCPFECEFCDVIQYVGRKQRHKPIDHILQELDAVYDNGYRSVLFADDNTTASRNWVKGLLDAVRDWNNKKDERVSFSTQLSIDAARDDDLLQLATESGMSHVFIGIETPNEESLQETGKRQNLQRNLRNDHNENPTLVEQVHRFYDFGIGVTGGMICGFDHDGADIFERQYEFGMQSLAPIFTISALAAPAATPLHARVREEGRLDEGLEVPGHPWSTNFHPMRMSRDELSLGIRWLSNKLYHPRPFGERVVQYIERLECSSREEKAFAHRGNMRSVDKDTLELISDIPRLDPESKAMWEYVMAKLPEKPGAAVPLMEAMVRYAQMRFMYEDSDFWDAEEPADSFDLASAGA